MESQSTNSGSDDSKDSKEDNNKKQTEQNEDGICPICHNQITNRALTDTCLHQFCFECIRQWSRTRNECPFCRNVYHNITHNIRSETSFDQIPVRNPNQIQNLENLLENENAPVFMYQQIVQMRYYSEQLIARLNARLTQLDPNSIEFIETLQRIANAEQRIEEFDQRNNQLRQEFRNQRLRNNGQNQNQNNAKIQTIENQLNPLLPMRAIEPYQKHNQNVVPVIPNGSLDQNQNQRNANNQKNDNNRENDRNIDSNNANQQKEDNTQNGSNSGSGLEKQQTEDNDSDNGNSN